MNPFIVFWRAARDLFDDLFLLIAVNIIWLLIAGPLLAVSVFLALNSLALPAAVVLVLNVLLFGPATAGLFVVAQRITEGRVATVRLFFEGFTVWRGRAWQVYGIWTLGLVTLVFNLAFYTQIGGALGLGLTIFVGYLVATWCMLLIYLGPLMILQEEFSLRLIWRNAAVMTLGRPIFTIVTAILMAVLIGISIFAAILPVLMTITLLALWGMRAAIAIVTADQERQRALEEAVEAEPTSAGKGRSGQVRPRK
jgi:hypothetical protein